MVPDISHTPRIISSLVEIPQNGIQQGSFPEVAPTCPNLHVSLYFFHLLFSKKHLVVIVFFMFCPVSVVVVAAKFLFEWFRTSHIPLEFFLTRRYPTHWDYLGMSGKGQEVCGLVAIVFFIFSDFPFRYPPLAA